MKKFCSLAFAVGFAAALFSAPQAQAVSYGFEAITSNNATQVAVGEAQFSVDVTQSGANVLFSFINSGPIASIIAQVYFDDDAGVLGSYVSESNTGSVNFGSDSVSPPNLPSQNNATPSFAADFGFDAQSPPGTGGNGVDPGETLGLILSLASGKTFNDVIMALDLGAGGLRLGIHGQGLGAPGGSEAFVNTTTVVPLPAAGFLLLFGLAGLGFVGHRRRMTPA